MAASPTNAPDVPERAFHALHSAEIVGKAFATQYYAILQQSPGLVYRFYQDVSKMGRSEDGSVMGSTTTMDAINEKIQSYGSLKADIKFVDAQESYDGGVIVLVTGSMINDDDSQRGFTQAFFLAPQEKGYYVLNDIFRYVEDDPTESSDIEEPDGGTTPVALSQKAAPPVPENHICDQSNGEVYNTCENGEVPVKAEKEEVHVQKKKSVAQAADNASEEPWVVVESNTKANDTPKKSYASIVKKDGPAAAASDGPLKAQDCQAPAPLERVSVAVPLSPNAEIVDEDNNHSKEAGEGCSIYMKNLPYNVRHSLVEEVLQHFGPTRSGGIQILHSKGGCYGFVEFVAAAAAQSAIEASPINIEGHQVVIEEKRSRYSRGNSFSGNYRGRYTSGRGGGGFRNGGSGGGYGGGYGGGRVYGRGERNTDDLGGRDSGWGYQSRSEGYSGRINRGGGSGHASTKVQRVSAQV
ncbi:hypothetical protein vseg_013491 [Gypsophila vaccaria]